MSGRNMHVLTIDKFSLSTKLHLSVTGCDLLTRARVCPKHSARHLIAAENCACANVSFRLDRSAVSAFNSIMSKETA